MQLTVENVLKINDTLPLLVQFPFSRICIIKNPSSGALVSVNGCHSNIETSHTLICIYWPTSWLFPLKNVSDFQYIWMCQVMHACNMKKCHLNKTCTWNAWTRKPNRIKLDDFKIRINKPECVILLPALPETRGWGVGSYSKK